MSAADEGLGRVGAGGVGGPPANERGVIGDGSLAVEAMTPVQAPSNTAARSALEVKPAAR